MSVGIITLGSSLFIPSMRDFSTNTLLKLSALPASSAITLLPSKIDGYELSEVSPSTDLYSRQHSFVEKDD